MHELNQNLWGEGPFLDTPPKTQRNSTDLRDPSGRREETPEEAERQGDGDASDAWAEAFRSTLDLKVLTVWVSVWTERHRQPGYSFLGARRIQRQSKVD